MITALASGDAVCTRPVYQAKRLRGGSKGSIIGYMMDRFAKQRKKLKTWRTIFGQRDQLIMDAWDAGMAVCDIASEMGISRKHIYTVLEREHQESWQIQAS
jgi:hypothetical protein